MLFTASLLALSFSGLALFALIRSDSKRHRRGQQIVVLSPRLRLILGLLSLLPAIVLTSLGLYTSLLIWLGGATLLGWVYSLLPHRYF